MPWVGSAPTQTTERTDGTRTGAQTWQEADAAAVPILSSAHDVHDEDINDMVNLCLKKDGGNQPSADLPMNSQKHTGVANATARTNYAAAGQVQDGAFAYAAAGGTGDVITATLSPAITAYAAGQLFLLKATAANTGAATANYNSVGAKAVKKGLDGSLALSANDIKSGQMALLAYDGTNLQLLNAPEFPSGTRMLFQQTAAPTGWTKDTTHNDKALRVVSGTASTGGTVAFETAFASQAVAGTVGNTTLTVNQIPSHDHDLVGYVFLSAGGGSTHEYFVRGEGSTDTSAIASEGGGGSHTHTFTGTAINLDVAFVDVILAAKD